MSSSERYRSTKTALVRVAKYYKDPDFLTDDSSIGKVPGISPRSPWTRAKDLHDNPVFIYQGATRNDVDQGALGDCWFLAGVAALATHHKALFEHVVPPDQDFNETYTGKFRFNFWWYGKWTEVIVDDYLPTANGKNLLFCRNLERPNEFWPALLEKAYAKLRGSYASLNGGKLQDAMVNLTGGISEVIDIQDKNDIPDNLYYLLMSSFNMNSLLGASIFRPEGVKKSDVKMKNGLIMGHAYSITGFKQLQERDELGETDINLIRVRNPWGKGEWNGAWSDGSEEFMKLNKAILRAMEYTNLNDGEFWIEFQDFILNFDAIKLCHLQVDAMIEQSGYISNKKVWKVKVYHKECTHGVRTGGRGNPRKQTATELYWNSPQYLIRLKQPDTIHSQSGDCTVIISLMEKEYRNSTDPNQDIAISFDLYKLKRPHQRSLNDAQYHESALKLVKGGGSYHHNREFCKRFILHPGDYVVIAYTVRLPLCTLLPHQETKFLLRIFTEALVETSVLEDQNEPFQESTRGRAKSQTRPPGSAPLSGRTDRSAMASTPRSRPSSHTQWLAAAAPVPPQASPDQWSSSQAGWRPKTQQPKRSTPSNNFEDELKRLHLRDYSAPDWPYDYEKE